MKIVVDTNIIFSGLLSPKGTIRDVLLNSFDIFQFYSPTYLQDELQNHETKLLEISGFSDVELDILKYNIFKRVDFLDLEIISKSNWSKAIELTKNIDEFEPHLLHLPSN